MSPSKSIGRRLVDVAQKARGRVALRYECELIPYFVGEIPAGVEKVMFVWERGTKVFVTDAEKVHPTTRAVFWKQYLKQTITVYQDHGKIVPKEYSFKIQSLSVNKDGEEEKKTIGKLRVDLAAYCEGQTNPQPKEAFFTMKPHGKLKISIKCTWLKDAKIDPETMTELSAPSEFTDGYDSRYQEEEGQEEEYDEQDLSGFGASSGARDAVGVDPDEPGEPVQKKKKKKKRSKRSSHRSIQEGEEGDDYAMGDPEDLRRIQEEEDCGQGESAGEPNDHPSKSKDGLSAGYNASQKKSWKEMLCGCCLPKTKELEPQEVASLLSKEQTLAAKKYNK